MSVNIMLWMVFGALAGWIASTIMKRNNQMGAVANVFIGVAGAILGGFLMNLRAGEVSGFNLYTLLAAVLSAVILLFLVGMTQSDATL